MTVSTPSSPPCSFSNPLASKHATPARSDSTPAPMPSSAVSTRSHWSATPAGSGETSFRVGQRASASPSRSPARTPWASAAAEASPISGSRPGSGASATGPRANSARPPAATERAKRGNRTQTIIEHMFASGGSANKG